VGTWPGSNWAAQYSSTILDSICPAAAHLELEAPPEQFAARSHAKWVWQSARVLLYFAKLIECGRWTLGERPLSLALGRRTRGYRAPQAAPSVPPSGRNKRVVAGSACSREASAV